MVCISKGPGMSQAIMLWRRTGTYLQTVNGGVVHLSDLGRQNFREIRRFCHEHDIRLLFTEDPDVDEVEERSKHSKITSQLQ